MKQFPSLSPRATGPSLRQKVAKKIRLTLRGRFFSRWSPYQGHASGGTHGRFTFCTKTYFSTAAVFRRSCFVTAAAFTKPCFSTAVAFNDFAACHHFLFHETTAVCRRCCCLKEPYVCCYHCCFHDMTEIMVCITAADTLLTHPLGTPNSIIPSFHHLKALQGHCVVESKPEGNKPDLRISQPWPELLEYCQSVDFDKQVGFSFVSFRGFSFLSFVLFYFFLVLFFLNFLSSFLVGVPFFFFYCISCVVLFWTFFSLLFFFF